VSWRRLAPTAYRDVSSWADDLIADGSKARGHGFHDYVESERIFTGIFDDMRARWIIPAR
jgi:hypothetical protein